MRFNMHFSAVLVALLLGVLGCINAKDGDPAPLKNNTVQVCPLFAPPEECPPKRPYPCQFDQDCPDNEKCCFDSCENRCLKSETKPVSEGVCPEWPPRPYECSQRAQMNSTCSVNSDCPGKQLCCQDACENHCTDPVPVENTIQVCPTFPMAEECPPERDDACKFDEECPKNRKCCFDSCENRCLKSDTKLVLKGEKPVIAGKREVIINKLTYRNITITCQAQGASSLRISWYNDGWEPLDNHVTQIQSSPDGKKIISQLIIPNARCKNRGRYIFVAKTNQKHSVQFIQLRLFNRLFATSC